MENEFDGNKVQASGEPIEINQEIQLGSVIFKLATIEKNQFGGYSFHFDGTEGNIVQCLVDLVGYPTNMSGGRALACWMTLSIFIRQSCTQKYLQGC
ncbi:MAG: hypothetical protein GX797_09395 [Chloroflexi bacterium]|nr:hypothetical protein [Chloroflexota bacterium]